MARPNRIGREEFGLPLGIADKRFVGMVHMKEEELCTYEYVQLRIKYRQQGNLALNIASGQVMHVDSIRIQSTDTYARASPSHVRKDAK